MCPKIFRYFLPFCFFKVTEVIAMRIIFMIIVTIDTKRKIHAITFFIISNFNKLFNKSITKNTMIIIIFILRTSEKEI